MTARALIPIRPSGMLCSERRVSAEALVYLPQGNNKSLKIPRLQDSQINLSDI